VEQEVRVSYYYMRLPHFNMVTAFPCSSSSKDPHLTPMPPQLLTATRVQLAAPVQFYVVYVRSTLDNNNDHV
jgi:hypothetical protein